MLFFSLKQSRREEPMSKIACYTIGRDTAASIPVQHETVSHIHAEVIPLPDGRVYVTDCASTNGTFLNEDGRWRRISQEFASAEARLRFGEVEVSVPTLLTRIAHLQGVGTARTHETGETGPSAAEQEEQLDVSHGVALDPETGEPVALARKSD